MDFSGGNVNMAFPVVRQTALKVVDTEATFVHAHAFS